MPSEKLEWVTTFVFSPTFGKVLLVKKNRGPDRVLGKCTGVGGKIEPGETPEAAAIREVAEEAGIRLGFVKLVAEMDRPDSHGYVFTSILPDGEWPETMTDEPVAMWDTHEHPFLHGMSERAKDTAFLIAMSLTRLTTATSTVYEIAVKE